MDEMKASIQFVLLGACRRIRSGFERPFFRLAASGCIDDTTNIACFAVFARRKNLLALGPTTEFSDRLLAAAQPTHSKEADL